MEVASFYHHFEIPPDGAGPGAHGAGATAWPATWCRCGPTWSRDLPRLLGRDDCGAMVTKRPAWAAAGLPHRWPWCTRRRYSGDGRNRACRANRQLARTTRDTVASNTTD